MPDARALLAGALSRSAGTSTVGRNPTGAYAAWGAMIGTVEVVQIYKVSEVPTAKIPNSVGHRNGNMNGIIYIFL